MTQNTQETATAWPSDFYPDEIFALELFQFGPASLSLSPEYIAKYKLTYGLRQMLPCHLGDGYVPRPLRDLSRRNSIGQLPQLFGVLGALREDVARFVVTGPPGRHDLEPCHCDTAHGVRVAGSQVGLVAMFDDPLQVFHQVVERTPHWRHDVFEEQGREACLGGNEALTQAGDAHEDALPHPTQVERFGEYDGYLEEGENLVRGLFGKHLAIITPRVPAWSPSSRAESLFEGAWSPVMESR